MLVTLAGMVTLARLAQFENTPGLMVVMLEGMLTLVNRVPANALAPMLVTLAGIVILAS